MVAVNIFVITLLEHSIVLVMKDLSVTARFAMVSNTDCAVKINYLPNKMSELQNFKVISFINPRSYIY